MFVREDILAEIRQLGVEAIPLILAEKDLGHASTALREIARAIAPEHREKACAHLVRGLQRGKSQEVRRLALSLIGDELAKLASHVDRVLELGLDPSEPEDLRARAFRILRAVDLPIEYVRQIGELIKIDTLGPGCPDGLRDAIFECLKAHAGRLPIAQTMRRLDPFLSHPDPTIRIHALALLGEVGDLDAVERMCMMPNTAEEIDRIQGAIGRILLRPTNLLSIRPEHFEIFIGHFLRKLGHYEVEVVGRSGDDGVDLKSCQRRENAKGPGDERWAVQCKRWTSKRVGLEEVKGFVAASRTERFNAKHALFITTSDFTREAQAYAEENSSAIELMSGMELLVALDRHFGAGRYTIRSRE